MKTSKTLIFCVTVLALQADAAFAYVGPGLGLGVIGAIAGILMTVLLGLFGIVWYPLKRIYLRGKQSFAKRESTERAEESDEPEDPET